MWAVLRVSVLLPVYNAAPFLQRALDSLQPDLAHDVEVIAVDDGSTDGSGDILERWAAPRVTVIHQDNGGLTDALRTAASRATTGLLARMDADDLNVPGRIRAARELLEDRHDVVLVSPWAQQIRADDTPAGLWPFAWDAAAVDRALYLTNPIAHGAAVFRRQAYEAVGGYQRCACEDLHLWDRMSDRGSVMLIPQILYRYRVGVDSYTRRHAMEQAAAAEAIKNARWERRPPSTVGALEAALRYRHTRSRAVHRAHLRGLAAKSRARRDRRRFMTFAAAWAAA
jgi:glycosyltransferase involved in cell wall biosynthesis